MAGAKSGTGLSRPPGISSMSRADMATLGTRALFVWNVATHAVKPSSVPVHIHRLKLGCSRGPPRLPVALTILPHRNRIFSQWLIRSGFIQNTQEDGRSPNLDKHTGYLSVVAGVLAAIAN